METKKSQMRNQVLAVLLFFSGLASATESGFPSKPVRLLVGYSAASGVDVVARVIATHLEQRFKHGVIVENKAGAGGVIATQEVARATPDGHTLLVAAMPQMAILPSISKVPYNAERDFAPVSQVVGTDLVLVVNPQRVPVTNMAEFAAWSRKQSTLFFGTPGPGTVGHFGAYLFADSIGTKIEPIHFRSAGEQVTGLLNGDIHAEFFSYAAAVPLVKAGRLKALLATSPARSSMFPDVPTAQEAGFPRMQFTSWYGVFAPAGTPPTILNQLSNELVDASKSPRIRTKLEEAGLRVTGLPRTEFSQTLKDDITSWSQVIKSTGFKSQD